MNKLDVIKKSERPLEMELSYANEADYLDLEDGYYSDDARDGKHLLRGVFATITKHWLLISLIVLVLTTAVAFYVAQQPDFYTSSARVQVNSEINPALKSTAVIVTNPGSDPAYFSTQLEILQSSDLMRRVVKTIDLENNEKFVNPQKDNNRTAVQNFLRLVGLGPDDTRRPPVTAPTPEKAAALKLKLDAPIDPNKEAERLAPYVKRLERGLKIEPVAGTRLIKIEYTHGDPEIAAKIANAIGDAYVLQNLEQKVRNNVSAGDFLEKRVAELQSEIRRGEERLINYARRNSIISLDSEQNTVVRKLGDLNTQLGQAENARIAAQTAYQAALQNEKWKANIVSGDAQITGLETQLSSLRQRLAQLKTQYTDEWPEVVKTKKEIETLEKQIANIGNRAADTKMAALQERLVETRAKERLIRSQFETQRADVIKQNEAAINYKIIQQEIDTNKSLLDGLLQRSKENEVVAAGTQNNVLVLDRATTPKNPMGPDRFKNIFLAFILALGFGIGIAFVTDWLNDSLSAADDLESMLGIPVLAGIPLAPLSISEKLLPTRLALQRKTKSVDRDYDMEAFDTALFKETYVQLATYLLLSNAGGPPRTVLVTSAEAGEGKTVNALNIATSLGKTKDKTLLIDCDLRCPRVHRIRGIENEFGLTNLLAADNLDDQLISQAIVSDEELSIDILPSGDSAPNPAGLLSSLEMEFLLESLTEKYSHIVIDSPPVLQFADSVILSTLVDSVLLVARDSFSTKHTVLKAKKLLSKVGANLTGIVMNGVPVSRPYYYNYYFYNDEKQNKAIGENSPQQLNLN